MNGIKSHRSLVGICGFAAVGAAVGLMAVTQGCSSSTTANGTGGAGGTASGAGGHATTGGGGSTGAGGTTVVTGAGGGPGCTAAMTTTAPTTGVIADFMGDGSAGVEIMGGVSAYGGTAAPTATLNGTALHITANLPSMATAQYVGTVLYFNNCIDASAFTGVMFSITGTLTGCTMQYSTNDSAHGDSTTGQDLKAAGPMGAYSPQLGVSAPFTSPASIPFTGTMAPSGGSPMTPIDPTRLTGIQWQFTIAPTRDAGATNCMADITIDDVKFYH